MKVMSRVLSLAVSLTLLMQAPASAQMLKLFANFGSALVIQNEETFAILNTIEEDIHTHGAGISEKSFDLTHGAYGVTGFKLSSVDMAFDSGFTIHNRDNINITTAYTCKGIVQEQDSNLVADNVSVQVLRINADIQCGEVNPDGPAMATSTRSNGVFVRDRVKNTGEVRFNIPREDISETVEFRLIFKLEEAPGQSYVLYTVR